MKARLKKKRIKNQLIVKEQELIKSNVVSLDNASPSGGWSNPDNGFGVGTDPTFQTHYLPPYEFTYQELTNLYQNSLVRRVIKLNMNDSTRAGFELTSDSNAEKAVEMKREMDTRFNWLALGRKMIGIKHNYGGGVLFADIDDGREPHEPLNINNVKKVWAFHPVDRYYAYPITTNPLLGDEKPGQPAHYKISLISYKQTQTLDVHESRIIRYPTFDSDDVLSSRERQRRWTWDLPTVQTIYDTVKRYGIGVQSSSSMLQGFVMDVFKISSLKEMKDLAGLKAHIRDQWALRNSMNANIIGKDDEIERLNTPVTGISDITQDIRRDVGMACEIPVPIIFSEESGGLGGSTLAESQKVWYSHVTANQVNRDEPMYRKMLELVSYEQKWDIEDIGFKFNELEYRSAIEQALLEKTDMETATLIFDLGMPEINILGAKFTGGGQKIGAIDALDVEAFQKDLDDNDQMEIDRQETENLIREADLKEKIANPTPDDKNKNLADANTKSKDEEIFILDF